MQGFGTELVAASGEVQSGPWKVPQRGERGQNKAKNVSESLHESFYLTS